jgi:hypothetical protein
MKQNIIDKLNSKMSKKCNTINKKLSSLEEHKERLHNTNKDAKYHITNSQRV